MATIISSGIPVGIEKSAVNPGDFFFGILDQKLTLAICVLLSRYEYAICLTNGDSSPSLVDLGNFEESVGVLRNPELVVKRKSSAPILRLNPNNLGIAATAEGDIILRVQGETRRNWCFSLSTGKQVDMPPHAMFFPDWTLSMKDGEDFITLFEGEAVT